MKINDKNDEWIGKIPQNWDLRKIKYVLNPRNEKNIPLRSKKILSLTAKQGVIPYSQKEGGGNKPKQNLSNYKLAYPGDIVMNSMNILSGAVGISKYFGCVSPVYYMLTCRNKIDDIRFFYYVFANKTFQNSLLGIGNGILIKESENGKFNTIRMRIPIEKLENMCLPYPAPQIQKRIADYLDKKVTKINKISKTIQQEIDALEEYRKSLITETVTKGLDKNVPMKDSGIEWIGEIPENWKVEKLKYLVETRESKILLSDVQYSYIGLENIEKNTGKYISTDSTYEDQYYNFCEKGDILYSKLRPNLSKAIIAPFAACCTGEFEVIKSTKLHKKYILYYLLSNYVTDATNAAIYGTKMPRVSWNYVKNLRVVFPNQSEDQIKIVNYLDKKLTIIEQIVRQKQQQLNHLDKYKQSIIYEYVTGKKQVPEKEGVKNAQ